MQGPRLYIKKPYQVQRQGYTAHFPCVDPDKQPEMLNYRKYLEGFDGGRKNAKVGFVYYLWTNMLYTTTLHNAGGKGSGNRRREVSCFAESTTLKFSWADLLERDKLRLHVVKSADAGIGPEIFSHCTSFSLKLHSNLSSIQKCVMCGLVFRSPDCSILFQIQE